MSDFYEVTGNPATGSAGSSSVIRSEFTAIETAMNKLPTITGNGGKTVRVNSGATALEVSKVTITEPATGATLTIPDGVTLTGPAASGTAATLAGTETLTNKTLASPTINSATMVTPALGTPASGVATNLSGTAANLTAGNVTTNANLTGHITSVGNAAVLGSFTAAQLNAAISDADMVQTGTAPALTGTNFTGTAAALNIGGNAATADAATNVTGSGTISATTTGGEALTPNVAANGVSVSGKYADIGVGGLIWHATRGSATVSKVGTGQFRVTSTGLSAYSTAVATRISAGNILTSNGGGYVDVFTYNTSWVAADAEFNLIAIY